MKMGTTKYKGSAGILAAGRSTRMGKTKQLLPLKEKYLLEQVIDNCSKHPFDDVFAVIGHESLLIRQQIKISDPRFNWVENPDFQCGQSTSFRESINHVSQDHLYLMVFLGDQPFIKYETISSIFNQGVEKLHQWTEPFILRPIYQNQIGHPVFFGNIKSMNISNISGDAGGRQLMSSISHKFKIPVDDPMIVFDIDTPEDYLKAERIVGLH